jgi:dihydroorotate dehydrogenase (fumarate)
MDLSVTYLGLKLAHPLMPGASPMADDLDAVRRLEDAGAAAIVLRSLFEEQIVREQLGAARHAWGLPESHEASSWLPDSDVFALGPDEYLEHLRRVRGAVGVPVIASLNGSTRGGWTRYAALMQQAGASALELNLFEVPTDPQEDAAAVERRLLEVVSDVREAVDLPLAVKISRGFTAPAHFVRQLERAGADGAVLFNRGYEPDLDVETLEVRRTPRPSSSADLPMRLRWLAIVSPATRLSLACSGGVHEAGDVLRALMAGASAVQLVSSLMQRGPQHLAQVLHLLQAWLDEREYASMDQVVGCLNLARCPDPGQYERANYMAQLQAWHVPTGWGRHGG